MVPRKGPILAIATIGGQPEFSFGAVGSDFLLDCYAVVQHRTCVDNVAGNLIDRAIDMRGFVDQNCREHIGIEGRDKGSIDNDFGFRPSPLPETSANWHRRSCRQGVSSNANTF